MQQSWREPQTFEELLQFITKAIGHQQRRASPVSASDLLGPGAASKAIQIGDWNDPLILFNGNYFSEPGALHSPDGLVRWTGSTIAKANGSGMQQVWNTDDLDNVRYYMRTYVADSTGQGASFSDWRNFATPSGYIEFENLETTLQDTITDLETGLGLILPPLKVYRQDTAPTNPDGLGRDLMVGDQWIDTNDDNHPYIWDGTTWADYASYVLGDIPTLVSAAQALAEAAASNAADALDLAEAANKSYVATTAPSNPDGAGRTLVVNDVWFDSDDDYRMYRWSGSAWVLADVGMTNPTLDLPTITGGLFQTDADASEGIKINSSALTAYNSSTHTATLVIDAATGAITMTGPVMTAADISGSTVTGGTVQSEATASRGVKINSAGMVLYDGSGTATLTLTASTGAIVLTGDMTGGGTITGPVFQTSADPDAGIKIASTGLVAYDGDGTPTIVVDGTDGAVTVKGAITSGSTIDGSTITGSLFQTSSDADTGIKLNSSGLVAYDGGGSPSIVVDAATGAIVLTGKLTSTALTSTDNLAIQGTNNYVQGTLYAQSTIPNPVSQPSAFTDVAAYSTTAPWGSDSAVAGIAPHHSDSNLLTILTTKIVSGVRVGSFWTYNKTTSAITFLTDSATDSNLGAWWNAQPSGFLTKAFTQAGGNYYILGAPSSIGADGTTDVVQRFSPTYVAGPVQSAGFGVSAIASCTIGVAYNTSNVATGIILLAPVDPSSPAFKVRVYPLDLSTTGTTNSYSLPSWTGGFPGTHGVVQGQLDYGSGTHIVAASSSVAGSHWVTDGSFSHEVLNDFNSSAYLGISSGLCWDVGPTGDTNRYLWGITRVSGTVSIYRFGRNPQTEYIRMAHTWADRTGTTHETTVGTSPVTVIRPARTRLWVSTQPAPESGSGGAEAANMTGLYAMTAATEPGANSLATTALRRQDQAKALGGIAEQSNGYSGVNGSNQTITSWQIIEPIKTTGTAPPTTNGFLTLSSVGVLQSQDYSSLVKGWKFSGDNVIEMGTFMLLADGTQPLNRYLGDTGWLDMTLINGWVNFDTGSASGPGVGAWQRQAQYRKINGVVYFRGVIRSGTIGSNPFFVMPASFRCAPATGGGEQHFAVASNSAYGQVQANSNGNLIPQVGSNTWVDLSTMHYIAHQ